MFSKIRGSMDTSIIFLGLIFGSVGMGYLVYGKKQQKGVALLSGLVLCGIPYFISNIFLLLVIGLGLMALPFIIQL
jgi:hypothetical protein